MAACSPGEPVVHASHTRISAGVGAVGGSHICAVAVFRGVSRATVALTLLGAGPMKAMS
ncbi:hypothetical protein [Nocardia farcinica]|uniref:hypothetical protein n=1 Tax=Nocardia farcinica TaxID=37329 RepID=UPI00189503FB|nr:hypothetical protein [Nocardia farcinica]MBF6267506.1 hypothetical protein [Nocardia farcinica]MBF6371856.1 hypothetical protein [Nocardia farcinica]MBF6384463.1 hypothetical protein [Nocardia farcinica]MBF6573051.1 hypothetical protein [Nocardia farcinica]